MRFKVGGIYISIGSSSNAVVTDVCQLALGLPRQTRTPRPY
jgi:hypothetical protein